MGLYEVPLYVTLLGFGIGTMLANFQNGLPKMQDYIGLNLVNYKNWL